VCLVLPNPCGLSFLPIKENARHAVSGEREFEKLNSHSLEEKGSIRGRLPAGVREMGGKTSEGFV